LAAEGASFDCASVHEIDLVLAAGVEPERISYGNTIKKPADIAAAVERGVPMFAFDSEAELDKLITLAPGSRVFCRILVDCPGADWPLSRKFGCDRDMAVELLLRAHHNGMDTAGVSFHVGSQQRDLTQWDAAIEAAAEVFDLCAQAGLQLRMLNVGGGMSADYLEPAPSVEAHARAITDSLRGRLAAVAELVVEPGRSIVADAGAIVAEVVLVARKSAADTTRWVYLDIGKFGGLPETAGEAIRFRITTAKDHRESGPVILAGPTCDSLDILYEHSDYRMPLDLQSGDLVTIHGAGAYTASYSSVGFNGFPPLRCHYTGAAANPPAGRGPGREPVVSRS
jgi:ornithine decarboxylase